MKKYLPFAITGLFALSTLMPFGASAQNDPGQQTPAQPTSPQKSQEKQKAHKNQHSKTDKKKDQPQSQQ